MKTIQSTNQFQDAVADALWAGCGTEIEREAYRQGFVPLYLRDNGETGDARLSLWQCGNTRAINTNGGAVWEYHDEIGFAILLSQFDD